MNDISAEVIRIYSEILDDYVGLWKIPRAVRDQTPLASASEIRSRSLQIARVLLEKSDVVAGQFDKSSFREWHGGAHDIIREIERQWPENGPVPNLGEICWFTLREHKQAD